MCVFRYSWNKYFQYSIHFQILVAVLGICFLFITFYMACLLSSVPLKTMSSEKSPVYVREDFIQVLITTDKSGMIGAVALVNSILANTKRPVHFYFVTSPGSADVLRSWIESLQLRSISYVVKSFNASNFGINVTAAPDWSFSESMMDYSKFYVTRLFPQAKDILIFLSNDVIVQGDIADLKNATIERNHFGALSTDCDTLTKIFHKNKNRYFHYLNMNSPFLKEKHINGEHCIFDMSVMVANITLWEEESVTDQLEYWFHLNEKEKIFLKNSALSPFLIVFNNRTSVLDSDWHVRNLGITRGTHYSTTYLQNAKLLQWNGHFKPWKHKSAISYLWSKYAVQKPRKISV